MEQWNTALDCTCVARHSQDYKKKRIIFNGLNWPKAISMEFPFIVKNCSQNVCWPQPPSSSRNILVTGYHWGCGRIAALFCNNNCLPNTPSSSDIISSSGRQPLVNKTIKIEILENISVPPSKLELVNTETTVTLHAGSEKSLTCRARNARPQAKIVWYLGEEKIVDQGRARDSVGLWGGDKTDVDQTDHCGPQ